MSPVAVQPIHSAAVLGAGLMGGGIAQLIASMGIPVRIKDIGWDAIRLAYQSAVKVLQKRVNQKKMTQNEVDMVVARFSATTDYVGFGAIDIVVEAVVENLSIKQTVLKEVESVVRPDTVLVSNTSALSITEMGRVLQYPNRFAGMHFFSPVHRMPLVEVIRGDQTDDQTIATVVHVAKALKKTPIVVKNGPGFLVNRLLIPYVNEAVRLLEDGIDVRTVDAIMTGFGMPIGPLALADEVGLDVGYKVAKILEDGLGDRMTVAESFERIHRDDRLKGKKSGVGFYRYENGTSQLNPDIQRVLVKKSVSPPSRSDCLDRLVLIMVNEAARCLDEGVVASPGHLDIAMVMGTGFPAYRLGLCRYADEVGIVEIVDRLNALANLYGHRFTPSQRLRDMATHSETFYKNEERLS